MEIARSTDAGIDPKIEPCHVMQHRDELNPKVAIRFDYETGDPVVPIHTRLSPAVTR